MRIVTSDFLLSPFDSLDFPCKCFSSSLVCYFVARRNREMLQPNWFLDTKIVSRARRREREWVRASHTNTASRNIADIQSRVRARLAIHSYVLKSSWHYTRLILWPPRWCLCKRVRREDKEKIKTSLRLGGCPTITRAREKGRKMAKPHRKNVSGLAFYFWLSLLFNFWYFNLNIQWRKKKPSSVSSFW